jgi:signal transduction histidine kinase
MNKKGTGLGLSICKNLIEKMGGKVDVKSIYGEGTAFKIQLSTKTNPYFANLKNRNTTI